MLMRLDDARTHGIQVKLPAEHKDQLPPQGCRHVDPGLVGEDRHRLWNSRLLELAVERDLVSQPGHCDQVEPGIFGVKVISLEPRPNVVRSGTWMLKE